MKKFVCLSFVIIYCSAPALNAQSFITPDDELVNGYSGKISGTDYEYHSCIPGLRQSIIIRAESGNDFMEWATDAPVLRDKKKYAAFIWVTAIGSSPGNAGMPLTTDINHEFSFSTDGRTAWTIDSDDGKTVLIHLRETDGKEAHLNLKNGLTGKPLDISGSDVTGKPIIDSDNNIKPFESKFFLINSGF